MAVEERLFSLVLALIATETGLTRDQVLSTVQGYRQRYAQDKDNSGLERQFERDKDDLRELGIPLETIDPHDNLQARYRIPKGLYDLPSDVRFSPDELMLLKLAATVWREGSLSAESRRALTKLRSLGAGASDPVLGYAPHLRAREASFEPLNRALDRREIVAFRYLKPGDAAPRRRVVAPRAVVQFDGRWHLFASDEGAGASRTFLLSRIVGPVVVLPRRTFDADDTLTARTALAELEALWQSNVAEVDVEAGSDAAVRLGKRGIAPADAVSTRVSLHFTDLNILADELAGYGPEVHVRYPESLRHAVHRRLQGVVAAHRDAESS
ncbi:WYL domain-containing protein [Cryobacterium frigoriphilum]|uniref:WYL domain-containing protein n=1 Tax=Cryobacterium frigoriphilum TaxID=1259150 RepID=A0A4R9A3V5_9MICO|nr:WYL domain-containing protein [Cryobacterium frigoriphilum]